MNVIKGAHSRFSITIWLVKTSPIANFIFYFVTIKSQIAPRAPRILSCVYVPSIVTKIDNSKFLTRLSKNIITYISPCLIVTIFSLGTLRHVLLYLEIGFSNLILWLLYLFECVAMAYDKLARIFKTKLCIITIHHVC